MLASITTWRLAGLVDSRTNSRATAAKIAPVAGPSRTKVTRGRLSGRGCPHRPDGCRTAWWCRQDRNGRVLRRVCRSVGSGGVPARQRKEDDREGPKPEAGGDNENG